MVKWLFGIPYEIAFWDAGFRNAQTRKSLFAFSHYGQSIQLTGFDVEKFLLQQTNPTEVKILDVGCGMTYLICFSDLCCTSWNWLIIPFNPLPLVFWHWRKYWTLPYAGVLAVWCLVMAAMTIWGHVLVDWSHIVMVIAWIMIVIKQYVVFPKQ